MIPLDQGGGGRGTYMAAFPNRCQYIKINGTQCGSPALRRNKFCYFHKRFHEQRISMNQARARRRCAVFDLPVLEDANSIQVALMQIVRLLALGHLDAKTAGLFLYALQTASSNLVHTSFQPRIHDVVLDPRAVGDTPLDSSIWEDEDFEDDTEEEEPLELSESEKAAILAERERRAQAEQKELTWATTAEESARIRRRYRPETPLRPQDSQALMKRLSQIIGGPAPPGVPSAGAKGAQ